MTTQQPLTFPAFAGDVVESLINNGYDANHAQAATTVENGSAWVGQKVTQTTYNRIVSRLVSDGV